MPLLCERNDERLPIDMIAEPAMNAVRLPMTSPTVPAESTRLATTNAKMLGIHTIGGTVGIEIGLMAGTPKWWP